MSAAPVVRTIFVYGLALPAPVADVDGNTAASAGVGGDIIVDIEVDVTEPDDPLSENLEDVVCYNKLTQAIKALVAEARETRPDKLAAAIADLGVDHPMARAAHVKVAVRDCDDAPRRGAIARRRRAL